ncbi:hypothetical protein ERJ75_001129200 [Trypanosoma vivax]|nr:hypothetical protein ERJ75_001129200 [Trypanosoma vivax]
MVGEVGKKRLLALIAFFGVAAIGCRQVAAGNAKGLTLAGAKSVCALALALEAAGRAHEIAANEATAKPQRQRSGQRQQQAQPATQEQPTAQC